MAVGVGDGSGRLYVMSEPSMNTSSRLLRLIGLAAALVLAVILSVTESGWVS